MNDAATEQAAGMDFAQASPQAPADEWRYWREALAARRGVGREPGRTDGPTRGALRGHAPWMILS